MPEQMIKKIKERILPEWKTGFIFALVVGLFAHLYKITNWLPNWDSLVFRYDPQNMLKMGRWFLPVVCAPGSFYDLPLVSGFFAILFHALGAVCIIKMFNVRKKVTAALIGALVASFPAVTSVMMYNYVADGYAFAFLLSTISAMLLTKDKPNYMCSIILIALSVGIYQAYITVTIMLLLLKIILEIIKEDSDLKDIIIKVCKFFITGFLGMVLYYIVLTLLLKVTKTQLLDYQGFGSSVSLSGIDISASLYVIKHSFIDYFFSFSTPNVFSIINSFIFVVTILFYICDAYKSKLDIKKLIILCFFVIMLPLGASVLAFINSSIDYHNLMKMGFLVFYLFFILQYEKTNFKKEKYNLIKLWLIFILSSILIFNHIIIANVSYHKLNMAYETSYGTLIRIADRIEQTEGAEECDSIVVIGSLPESEAYSAMLPPDITGTTDGYILRKDDEIVGQSVLCSALNDYCKKDYKILPSNKKKDLLSKIDLAKHDNWPEKNSIFIIDNILIIKLGD